MPQFGIHRILFGMVPSSHRRQMSRCDSGHQTRWLSVWTAPRRSTTPRRARRTRRCSSNRAPSTVLSVRPNQARTLNPYWEKASPSRYQTVVTEVPLVRTITAVANYSNCLKVPSQFFPFLFDLI